MELKTIVRDAFEDAYSFKHGVELSDSVAQEPRAVGFIGLPYVHHATLIAISSSDHNKAVMPIHFTVGTEDWVMRRLWLQAIRKKEKILIVV